MGSTNRQSGDVGLPRHRAPTHPGELLSEEYLRPLGLSQDEAASKLGVSLDSLRKLLNRQQAVSPDTALRLAEVFETSAELWLGLQQDWDDWHALRAKE